MRPSLFFFFFAAALAACGSNDSPGGAPPGTDGGENVPGRDGGGGTPPDRAAPPRGGGSTDAGPATEVWELSLPSPPSYPVWTKLSPAGGPPPKSSSSRDYTAVYDSANQQVVLFGGTAPADGGGDTPLGQVWTLSVASTPPLWAQVQPGGAGPGPRVGHAAAY